MNIKWRKVACVCAVEKVISAHIISDTVFVVVTQSMTNMVCLFPAKQVLT